MAGAPGTGFGSRKDRQAKKETGTEKGTERAPSNLFRAPNRGYPQLPPPARQCGVERRITRKSRREMQQAPACGRGLRVEQKRFELSTSSLRTKRSPS